MPNSEVWCGRPNCRGVFGRIIMDAGPNNQLFVLDLGFHKNGDTWEISHRAEVMGSDRRKKLTTFAGPRTADARYSPPERPALFRCPRCSWVSAYNGEGEPPEAAAAANEPPSSTTNGDSFTINASEWWKDPRGYGRRAFESLKKLFPPQD